MGACHALGRDLEVGVGPKTDWKPLTRTVSFGLLVCAAVVGAGPSAAAPNAVVEGLADGPLRSQIELAVGEARNPPRTVLDARRRASDAARDATALLRSEGYY